jgi:prepilin-type N-terminal cleavage/methylation domain-containing protein
MKDVIRIQQPRVFKNRKALTLIECLVAVILLSITLVAGMAFYFNASAIMGQAMHKKMAMEMINQKFEQLRRDGYSALTPTVDFVNGSTVTFGDFSVQTRQKVTNIDGNSSNGVRKVEIEVSWTEAGKSAANTIAMSTYVAGL